MKKAKEVVVGGKRDQDFYEGIRCVLDMTDSQMFCFSQLDWFVGTVFSLIGDTQQTSALLVLYLNILLASFVQPVIYFFFQFIAEPAASFFLSPPPSSSFSKVSPLFARCQVHVVESPTLPLYSTVVYHGQFTWQQAFCPRLF